MKSRFGLVLVLAAVVAVAGLAVLLSSSAATAQSSSQQGISPACCPFSNPAQQVMYDGGCKSKSDPNEGKKKCDPNEGKKTDPNCHKK